MTGISSAPEQLAKRVAQAEPTDSRDWNPPLSGTMDLRISKTGQWLHEGDPIGRLSLIKLFASILRREADGEFYLVTPVEKWRISVDVAPFIALTLDVSEPGPGQLLTFTTNLGETVSAGTDHPIRVAYAEPDSEPTPLVLVRPGLWALINRAVFVQLAEVAERGTIDQQPCYFTWSDGIRFRLGPV